MLHWIIYKAICGAFVMFFREYHKDHHPQVVWVERGPGLTMSSRLCVFASGMFVERLPPDTCEFRLCRLSCEIAFILGTEVDLQIEAGLLSSKRSSRRAWFFVMIQGLHKPSLLFLHRPRYPRDMLQLFHRLRKQPLLKRANFHQPLTTTLIKALIPPQLGEQV